MLLFIGNIYCEEIVFNCDFDSANNQEACGGSFTNNINGQTVGVFDSSNSLTTNLKYDVTDYSSISKSTLLYFDKF